MIKSYNKDSNQFLSEPYLPYILCHHPCLKCLTLHQIRILLDQNFSDSNFRKTFLHHVQWFFLNPKASGIVLKKYYYIIIILCHFNHNILYRFLHKISIILGIHFTFQLLFLNFLEFLSLNANFKTKLPFTRIDKKQIGLSMPSEITFTCVNKYKTNNTYSSVTFVSVT